MMANKKARRRRFGAVRMLPSGQWQARYRGPDGVMRPADRTFPGKTDAEVWLSVKEAEILNGAWINPDDGKILLADFGKTWIEERPKLRPKTVDLYQYLLRSHIAPHFEAKTVAGINEAGVRRWRKTLLDSGVSEVTTAKAYRLLRAILNTAADDGMIRRNPCRIKGAGSEESPERPVLSVSQVFALAEAIDPPYRALVLLGTFASLRWGELAALRRDDVDLVASTVRIERQLDELPGGGHAYGPPKSAAGKRTVPIPNVVMPDIRKHLATHKSPDPGGLVFTSPQGTPLRRGNFRRRVWLPALTAAGLPPIHFHDLRHTGNNLAAQAGANLRELMDRMGHASTRAALIYLHSSSERQRAIADTVSKNARAKLRAARKAKDGSGTEVARNRKRVS